MGIPARTGARARRRAIGGAAVIALTSVVFGLDAAAQDDPPDLTAEPLTATDRVTASKAPTSRLAETDPELLGRTDTTPVEVLIKLDYDSVATYTGTVEGFSATSPSVTGRELTGESRAERRYETHIASQEDAFEAALAEEVPNASVGDPLRTVYGGVTAVVPANRIADVLALDGVVAVQQDKMMKPLTDSSPEFIGATSLYPALGGDDRAGSGVIVGILDTGAWPEHPSFADDSNLSAPPPKFDGTPRVCEFGDNPLTPANDPFACNDKLISGEAFLDTYLSNPERAEAETFHGPRDSNGHGTHTSTTSAGNALDSAEVFGVERGPINGIAPGAWVAVYKVCGFEGCFFSDSAAAVGQAILDGVDVINFSIGGGTTLDPAELAFLDAYAAGVFVATSAGNSGPGAATAGHLFPWTTTVAASTQTREFATTLNLTAGNGDTFTVDGASITAGAGPLPVVLAQNVPGYNPMDTPAERAQCVNPPTTPNVFDGLIVACQRGVVARIWKSFVVSEGSGEGMVLYNPALADIETDSHWVPTIHLADGTGFVAFMTSHTGVTGSFPAGQPRDGQGDVMAAFSSRGPGGNFIKPDITAPGVQILAGASPAPDAPTPDEGGNPPGEFFQAIAGTSMSSPHIAGSAALLAALHPEWTPGQIKSALMTTATQSVVKEDLTTPADPFDFGAGRVDLNVAGNPGLTFDASAADMLDFSNDPLISVHLNLPSVNAPVMPGRLETTRVATNVSGRRLQYAVETSAPDGSSISVSPRRINLAREQSAELDITIESTAETAQYFGEIRLVPRTPGFPTLHLPVAFIPRQGTVSLMSECDPTEIVRGTDTRCTITAQNNGPNVTTVDVTTSVNKKLDIRSAIGAPVVGDEIRLHAELAGDRPGIPSVDPGALFGFLPLAGFDIDPIAVGDEDIVNFNVPAFPYNGRTANRIGVDSNGYLVVGGGTAQDNNCCDLPAAASPARPNNILAPFWTDLDGTGAEGIRVGTLTDGANSWLVVEWQVNVFGTTSNRHFQTWIGLSGDANPGQDITFAYDPEALPADPNGQDFRVGAENEFGEGDVARFLPTEDLRVTSTAPAPGGTASYVAVIRGARPGEGVVTTEMSSPQVAGITVVRSNVTVTRR